jgi:hypothetical protein
LTLGVFGSALFERSTCSRSHGGSGFRAPGLRRCGSTADRAGGGAAPPRIEPAAVAPSGGGGGVGAAPRRIEVAAAAASASRCAPPRVEAAAAGRAPSVLLPSPTPPKTGTVVHIIATSNGFFGS